MYINSGVPKRHIETRVGDFVENLFETKHIQTCPPVLYLYLILNLCVFKRGLTHHPAKRFITGYRYMFVLNLPRNPIT